MTFNQYQTQSNKTAVYPDKGNNFIYPTLGLAGEAGEVADKIKKVLRDQNGIINNLTKKEISKELGDVLWYVSQLATELNISLDQIAEDNIKKLSSRQSRGVLTGSGDER
ncbi:nucleoside triphosphate pyrophosphohydrolase family protein [Patescibacteria group bacterium]|nr:nucleoside triphosphate pyrophosphohydrolase family protein [Patescibacteria group bacterium]MBU0620183.1 nucleoside triphosphate pyrophosphohydrolase family protein [Patescibacteria group bacterium]MBU1421233.1 nucleoside triphosphate pyrophosphohydrolase family protein [Patescibacteria group bacterium]MBU1421236.1 nucleoside triphosphate pyrophosphohydrolase family protein [Patescibacteria group bacterium]MBU1684274.1 nucleoside triphosphate pyrophosphohydrolase family protein [Patescibact